MNALTLTNNAASKLAKLKSAEGNDALMLRVYVTGGGCSGFSYGFDFAEEARTMTPLLIMAMPRLSWTA